MRVSLHIQQSDVIALCHWCLFVFIVQSHLSHSQLQSLSILSSLHFLKCKDAVHSVQTTLSIIWSFDHSYLLTLHHLDVIYIPSLQIADVCQLERCWLLLLIHSTVIWNWLYFSSSFIIIVIINKKLYDIFHYEKRYYYYINYMIYINLMIWILTLNLCNYASIFKSSFSYPGSLEMHAFTYISAELITCPDTQITAVYSFLHKLWFTGPGFN